MNTPTSILCTGVVLVQLTRAVFLIGSEPRGDLWVAAVNVNQSEIVLDSRVVLRGAGGSTDGNNLTRGTTDDSNLTTTVPRRSAAQRSCRYGTISYDLFSDRILVELLHRDGSFRGLTTIPACQPTAAPPNVAKVVPDIVVLENVIIVDEDNPFLVVCAGTGHDCGWSAFTFFYSLIYFLFVGQYGNSKSALTLRVELRAMTGCADILFPSDVDAAKTVEFSILKCSRIVSIILEVPPGESDGWTISAGKHMTVEPMDDSLHFFFQLSRTKPFASQYGHSDLPLYGNNKLADEYEFKQNDFTDSNTSRNGELVTLNKRKKNGGNIANISTGGTEIKENVVNFNRGNLYNDHNHSRVNQSAGIDVFTNFGNSSDNFTSAHDGNTNTSATDSRSNSKNAVKEQMYIEYNRSGIAMVEYNDDINMTMATNSERNISGIGQFKRTNGNKQANITSHPDYDNNLSNIIHESSVKTNAAYMKGYSSDNKHNDMTYRDNKHDDMTYRDNKHDDMTYRDNKQDNRTRNVSSIILRNIMKISSDSSVNHTATNTMSNSATTYVNHHARNSTTNRANNGTMHNYNDSTGNIVLDQTNNDRKTVDHWSDQNNISTNGVLDTPFSNDKMNKTGYLANSTTGTNNTGYQANSTTGTNNTDDQANSTVEMKNSEKSTTTGNTDTNERLYEVETSLYRVTNIGRVDLLHVDTDRVNKRTLLLRGLGGVSVQGTYSFIVIIL